MEISEEEEETPESFLFLVKKKKKLRDPRYIEPDETLIKIVKTTSPQDHCVYTVVGHPSIPISECRNPTCGKYRFQHSNSGGGFHARRCFSTLVYSAEEFARVASRYVKRCPVCDRMFITGGGQTRDKIENAACYSEKCRLVWAENHRSEENTCTICGKLSLQKLTVTTVIRPFKEPMFVGSEFCVCNNLQCTRGLRAWSRDELKSQATAIFSNPAIPNTIKEAIRKRTCIF